MANLERSVISCIDGSSVSNAVGDYACWLANKMASPLTILHTIERHKSAGYVDYSGSLSLGSQQELLNGLTEQEQSDARALIERSKALAQSARDKALDHGINDPKILQLRGTLSENLIELEDQISILVVGIKGEKSDEQGKSVGTQLESVIRSMHRPILVVNKEFQEPKRTMLAYDGSEACRKALKLIASNQAFAHIPCDIVHVGTQGDKLIDEAVKILKEANIKATGVQLDGKIEEVLPAYQLQNDIDVTLMGAFSHTRIRGFLMGSFTAKMIANTNRPLFLLR